ncbi:carbonic anhydrase [Amnibacterium endophyticum]|uniref:carbonic anhydrase n=1 Tax=Amnibacterium endophyticum TaxID=2109337 RepID=A0ABW4LAF3_9MICO
MSAASIDAWRELAEGNARFIADEPRHPNQDARRRAEVAQGQHPVAALLGCSDSRVAAEVLFDRGLGDLFVIRNAGQVASASALASIEYAVAVLDVPLVVVLAHDSCGAVKAAIDAEQPDAPMLPPLIAAHVDRIVPAVHAVADGTDADAVGQAHLEATVAALLQESELLAAAVAEGSVAVIGAEYRLADGRVHRRFTVGEAE